MTAVNQVLMAIPAFVTGVLLTYVFGLVLRWLVQGSFFPGDNLGGSLWYFLFPPCPSPCPGWP